MLGIASLLVVVTLGLLVTRVATVALRTTGLSHDAARFQARSAFSGVGFTTTESEDIVNNPARRGIVRTLMLLSGAGVLGTLASLLLSFANTTSAGQAGLRVGVLIAGLFLLSRLAASKRVDRRLSRIIEKALARWSDLEVQDYVRLLHMTDDYSIAEMGVEAGEWLECRPIGELHLAREGVVVLAVRRGDGRFVGAPTASARLQAGDTLVAYGRTAALDELQDRGAGADGDRAHEHAATEQQRVLETEAEADRAQAE